MAVLKTKIKYILCRWKTFSFKIIKVFYFFRRCNHLIKLDFLLDNTLNDDRRQRHQLNLGPIPRWPTISSTLNSLFPKQRCFTFIEIKFRCERRNVALYNGKEENGTIFGLTNLQNEFIITHFETLLVGDPFVCEKAFSDCCYIWWQEHFPDFFLVAVVEAVACLSQKIPHFFDHNPAPDYQCPLWTWTLNYFLKWKCNGFFPNLIN